MKKVVSLVCSLCLLVSYSVAQNTLQSKVNSFVNDANLKHAGVSVSVIDVGKNQLVAGYHSHQSVVPASSLKVLTTASALGMLGRDFKWETHVEYDGFIQDKTLQGNLYIVGSGDPTFGYETEAGDGLTIDHLDQLIRKALVSNNIQRISGDIIIDNSWVVDSPTPWSWQYNDIGNYYGAGVYGVNFNENTYRLVFRQNTKLGATPQIIQTRPAIPELNFTNEVKNAPKGTGDNAYIFGMPNSYDRIVRGTIPVGSKTFTIKGSIPDPPMLVGKTLQQKLKEDFAIALEGSVKVIQQKENSTRKRLWTHYSRPLSEIAAETNERSVNLFAEAMLKKIGERQQGQATRNAGIQAIQAYWADRGIDMSGCFLEDGSGLSARNSITSYQLAQVIRKTYLDDRVQPVFFANGRSSAGALKHIYNGATGTVYAKSGTLKRVRSYTGYVKKKDGTYLTFSIVVNNFDGSGSAMRRKITALMKSLAS